MGEIPMPGGWTLSTAWLPVCGQGWWDTAVAFVGMWALMMPPMMLPALVPLLWRYAQALGERGRARRAGLVALAGAGYFAVWIPAGGIVFVVGAALAQAAVQVTWLARDAPAALALVVVLAGAFQCTARKARYLAGCRATPPHAAPPARPGPAWRYGLLLGLLCSRACAGFTAILLAIGAMDPRAMLLVAAAITAERLAPAGERVARATGAASVAAGLYLMARAICLRWP